jgi:murein DD-endopeptidase MepM/ murein hydrolase activator NlpD
MRRKKYYYDTRTCNYEKIKTSKWDIFFDALGFLALSFVVAIGIFWGYITYFDSPKEIQLKEENALLQLHYERIQQEIDKSGRVLAYLQDQDDNLYRTILETEPIPAAVRKAGVGGTNRYQELTNKSVLIATTLKKADQLKRELYIQSKSYDELTKLAKAKERMLACIPAIQPISNKGLKRISDPFGMRLHPIHRIPTMHTGIDFAAPKGTPIYATGNGTIKLAKKNFGGYGNQVVIDHGYGLFTLYGHMKEFKVKAGQRIKRGECIGYVGSTGISTAPHLHYEVIKNKKRVNPAHYFTSELNAAEYEMILALASRKIYATPEGRK